MKITVNDKPETSAKTIPGLFISPDGSVFLITTSIPESDTTVKGIRLRTGPKGCPRDNTLTMGEWNFYYMLPFTGTITLTSD